jgi:hypothetical protein
LYIGITGDTGQVGGCLKYLCGFLLSLRAQAMPLSIFKSKYRQGPLKTASPSGPDFEWSVSVKICVSYSIVSHLPKKAIYQVGIRLESVAASMH